MLKEQLNELGEYSVIRGHTHSWEYKETTATTNVKRKFHAFVRELYYMVHL